MDEIISELFEFGSIRGIWQHYGEVYMENCLLPIVKYGAENILA